MAYDPRTSTGIPTEPVGSLPRPSVLQQAYARYDAGEIGKDELAEQQEAAIRDSIERFEATGSPIISDGEQRWSSFATYPITDTLTGTGLAPTLTLAGGQYFAIFADGHNVVVPQNLGLDATNQVYSPIHTHDERGVIHIEADTKDFVANLGEVFDVWGVKFDKQCLGGFCDGVKVYLNGKEVDQYADLPLHAHDNVTIVAGTPPKDFTPDTNFKFAPGE